MTDLVAAAQEPVTPVESELAAINEAGTEDVEAVPHLAQAHDSHEQQETVLRSIAANTALSTQVAVKADKVSKKQHLVSVTKGTVTAQTGKHAKPSHVTAQRVVHSAPVRTASLGNKQKGVRLAS